MGTNHRQEGSRMVKSVYIHAWSKIANALHLTHSLPLFIDEIEFCLIGYVVFLATDHSVGYKVPLISCFGLHLLRGGYRWQLSPIYLAVLIFFTIRGYPSVVKFIQISCAIVTIGLCHVIPSIPLMDGRGKSLGVQDLTFDGPSGQFWVRCFYPTLGTDNKPAISGFPVKNKFTVKTFLSIVTILLSAYAISYVEVVDSVRSLLCFSVFGLVHFLRLVYDVYFGLPSVAYISRSEFPSVLYGISSFSKLPSLLFSHMSHMRINCTQDAPVYNDSEKMGCKLKVAFVLHGLGGTRSMYSFICMRLASEGYFVVCPEFGDGTACMSHLPDGVKRIYTSYSLMDGEVEISEGNWKFRRDQLEHRAQEMSTIVKYFSGLSGPGSSIVGLKAKESSPSARWKRNSTGQSSRSYFIDSLSPLPIDKGCNSKQAVLLDILNPCIVGHSFGGATAIHVQRSMDKHAAYFRSTIDSISGVIVLDPWMWPISNFEGASKISASSPVLATDIFESTPYLVMHTEYFQWPENLESERTLVKTSKSVIHLRVQDAGHNNFTDTGFLSPVISGRVMSPKKTGMQDPVVLQGLINDMLAAFLSDSYRPISAKLSNGIASTDISAISSSADLRPSGITLNRSLSLAQKTNCFEILETRW